MTVEQDLKRFNAAVARKDKNWKRVYQDAYRYVTPQRDKFYYREEGQRKTQYKFDSTARQSLRVFVSRIMGAMYPSWQIWAYLQAGSDIPEEKQEDINQQLEEATEILFDYINHSNFESQMTTTLTDLAYGTGCLMVERGDDNNLLRHKNISLDEIYLEEGPFGTVETVFRKHNVKARNVTRNWPNAVITPELQHIIDESPDTDIDIVQGSVYEPKEDIYRQTVIWAKQKHELFTWNENTSPYIVPRWEVHPGELYGEGPILEVLEDIKSLNLTTEYTLRRAAFGVAGAYTAVSDGIINPYTIKIRPNTIIPVASNASTNPSLAPLQQAGDVNTSEIVREDLKQTIREALFANALPDVQDGVRTATEWQIRMQEMLKNSGAQLGRQHTEAAEKYLRRAVDLLSKEGKMPQITIDGKEVTIKFTSPLAKQRELDELEGLNTYMNYTAMLEQFAPGLTALSTKVEEIPRYVANKVGGIGDLVRTQEEMNEAGKQVMAAGEQMMGAAGGEMPPEGGGEPVV